MKRRSLLFIAILASIVFVRCEKKTITPNAERQTTALQADDNRIEFLKSATSKASDYANQQPFTLHMANQLSATEIAFVVEYLAGDEYKLHEFDFVWDEKLEAEGDKVWMNIDLFHKTIEENAKNTVRDSTLINISELTKLDEATRDKLWLRFKNTTKEDNVLELQYNSNIENTNQQNQNSGQTENQNQNNNSATGNENNTQVPPQDSTSVQNS